MKETLIQWGLRGIIFIAILCSLNKAYSEEAGEDQGTPSASSPSIEGEEKKEGEAIATSFVIGITPELQIVDLDTGSSKATEYRSLPEGLYIDQFLFHYGSQTQEFRSEIERFYPVTHLIDDGHGGLNYRRYGLLDMGIEASKFPHDYGPTYLGDISTQRDIYNLRFKFTPGDRLIISTNFSIEERDGKRPIAMENLTVSDSTAILELAESTDYTTTTIDLGMEYIDDIMDIQLNNSLQIFSRNLRDEIRWDNPYEAGATGKAMAADDYIVQTLSIRPSIRLTDNMKFINNLLYSKVTSDITLVPFSTAGIGEPFQQNVLDTDVRSLTFSSILSTKPLSDVRLNIKFRYNTYKNDTPGIEDTPSYVMLDGDSDTFIRYPRMPRYVSYNTRSIGFDGAWHLTNRLALDAGIENKNTLRSEREVEKENEKRLFFSVHSAILDNLYGRFGYAYSRRRGNYDPAYYNTVYDPDPANNVTQHPLMRSFDLSERDTHTVKASFDYSPSAPLNIGTALSLFTTDHPDVTIGRNHSNGEAVSLHAEYALLGGLVVYSEYFYDRRRIEGSYTWTFDSGLTYPQDPNPQYSDFTAPVREEIEDVTSTYAVGFDYDIDKWLSFAGRYNRYDYEGSSRSFPEINSLTDTYELSVSYRLIRALYPLSPLSDARITAAYYIENYSRDDYALDNFPDAGPDAGIDSFLGIREPDYKLHVISVSLSLSF